MSHFKIAFSFFIFLLFSTIAHANCQDIRDKCYEEYQLDLRACGDYLDERAQDCRKRALEQFNYCKGDC